MLSWIREKFGTAVIGVIIGGIAMVFVFYGVFSPKTTRGLGEGAVAGTVNGDPITLNEFNRSYNYKVEFYKKMGGGKISDEQLKQFHLRENTFEELARQKVMLQEAARQGMLASDEEVKEKIRVNQNFQKDGQFDVQAYKQILEANGYSAGSFEKLMREEISGQKWQDYFKDRVHVSDDEIKDEFMISQDKRNVKFVLLTTETGKKGIKVDPADVTKFLADPAKMNVVKTQYETRKETQFKGKTFDQVKEDLARDMLAGDKVQDIQKINQALADQVASLLSADKGSDAKINAILKPYNIEVRTTGLVSRQNPYLPGIGEAKDLMADAFAKKSPIDAAQGGKPKKYTSAAWTVVALVTDSKSPDLSQLPEKRDDIYHELAFKKERELYDAWLKKIMSTAKIDRNPSVLSDGEQG